MALVNLVHLKGYLEIVQAETVSLDGRVVPVLHAYIHTGEILASHRLIITSNTAEFVLNTLRRYQDTGLLNRRDYLEVGEGGTRVLYGDHPLVMVEGRLLSRRGHESVIEVKWITFLTIDDGRSDPNTFLQDLLSHWKDLSEAERKRVRALLSELRISGGEGEG